ncbi:MAG: thermonuclease family protein [Pseudomonadota bacterium]
MLVIGKLKTPNVKAFGVLLFGFNCFLFSCSLRAECGSNIVETAQLEYVYDGDTLKLKDGRNVRVLGINTPEIDHGAERIGQPLGKEATSATVAFFKTNKTVKLSYDTVHADHYGRSLANVYDAQGNSLAAHLLRLGLGFHVVVPPNISSAKCLRSIEAKAKQQGLGVWGNAYWKPQQASELTLRDTGFKRVQGKVVKVHQAKSVWLELDGPLSIHIPPADGHFMAQDWQQWQGKQVEVRGWITKRRENRSRKGKTKSAYAFKLLTMNVLAEDVATVKAEQFQLPPH